MEQIRRAIAWHPSVACALAFLLCALALHIHPVLVWLALGGSVVAWFAAVRIERASFVAQADALRARLLDQQLAGDEPGSHQIILATPEIPSGVMSAPRHVYITTASFGPHTVLFRDGGYVDHASATWHVAQSSRELRCDQIVSVEQVNDQAIIGVADEQPIVYVAATGIAELVNALRQRLRAEAAQPAPRASFPQTPAAPSPPVVQREIIERQILVMRCKFCDALTPVDLSDCRSCGAQTGGLLPHPAAGIAEVELVWVRSEPSPLLLLCGLVRQRRTSARASRRAPRSVCLGTRTANERPQRRATLEEDGNNLDAW